MSEARSSLQNNRSRGRVLEALMDQKKLGKIPGIYGRLVSISFDDNLLFCIFVSVLMLFRISVLKRNLFCMSCLDF